MIDDQVGPRRVPASVKRNGDFWVLVPDDPADVAIVNTTGHQVFQLCDGSRTPATIANEIAVTTGADPNVVQPDVEAFLDRLTTAGLLKVVS